jgi:hypothetical protein
VQPRVHFVLVALLCRAGTSAQVERLPSKLKISDTDLASCYEDYKVQRYGKYLSENQNDAVTSPGAWI